jgi:hypothetical protein
MTACRIQVTDQRSLLSQAGIDPLTQRFRVFIDWLVECFPARVAGEGKSGT